MSQKHRSHTTTFYHPDTIRKLQASGVEIRELGEDYYPERYGLCSRDEVYLVGNKRWLEKMCKIYRLKMSV